MHEAPSTTEMLPFVPMFKQVYGRPGLWLIDAIIFLFPETAVGILTKPAGNHRLLKCVYIYGKFIHKYDSLSLWLSGVFKTSALKLLYGCQQNFAGSKYMYLQNVWGPATNWYFFLCRLTITRLLWFLINLLVFNFSATAVRILTHC